MGWYMNGSVPSIDPTSNFTRFSPPNVTDTPETLFEPNVPQYMTPSAPRFMRRFNPEEFLIYADGACSGNGTADAAAGCAFVFRPATTPGPTTNTLHWGELGTLGSVSLRLETRGPQGDFAEQTSNRAELRAIIAILGFRFWLGEGCRRLVIATDSSYVVEGSTQWIKKWQWNGWTTAGGKPVKNRDLWEELIKELHRWSEKGLHVQFWLIPRSLNTVADGLAKQAIAQPAVEQWTRIFGALC
ncbi:MAG: hypothetical protein M1820_006199 [Bogoriella megaspora]|nr:MAG: hypothetical protein M1820_006199 [Bogoriella megaspora]